jgi:hypothetical protein
MPDLISVVTGSAAIAVGAFTAVGQYIRLKSPRLRRAATGPSGLPVRVSVFIAANGVWLLTGWWPVLVAEVVVLVWTVAVWTRSVRRSRRASRAS